MTRGQSGATGILVDYSGGNVAGGFSPSTPYSNAATNPQVTTYAKQVLKKLEVVFPGSRSSGTGRRRCRRRSSIRCSTARTRTGGSASTRRSPATRACRRATSTSPASTARRLPGLHGRRRDRGRPRRERGARAGLVVEAAGGDVLRRDPDLHALLFRIAPRVLVLAEVLLRELVDLCVRTIGRDLGGAVDGDPLVASRSGRRRARPRADPSRGASASRARSPC